MVPCRRTFALTKVRWPSDSKADLHWHLTEKDLNFIGQQGATSITDIILDAKVGFELKLAYLF